MMVLLGGAQPAEAAASTDWIVDGNALRLRQLSPLPRFGIVIVYSVLAALAVSLL